MEDVLRNRIFTNKCPGFTKPFSIPHSSPEQSLKGIELRTNKLHGIGCEKAI